MLKDTCVVIESSDHYWEIRGVWIRIMWGMPLSIYFCNAVACSRTYSSIVQFRIDNSYSNDWRRRSNYNYGNALGCLWTCNLHWHLALVVVTYTYLDTYMGVITLCTCMHAHHWSYSYHLRIIVISYRYIISHWSHTTKTFTVWYIWYQAVPPTKFLWLLTDFNKPSR